MSEECLFCKILKNEIPCDKVFEDKHTLAFRDISPKAPTHILVIPYEHYAGIHEIPSDNMEIIKYMFTTVNKVVEQEKLLESGYRLVINFGENSGQEVPHIHIHILAGRYMKWPPG